jgi:hypothetical protein
VQGDAGHPVDRVVDKGRVIGKMEDQGGGEAQVVADSPKMCDKVMTTSTSVFSLAAPKPKSGNSKFLKIWSKKSWHRLDLLGQKSFFTRRVSKLLFKNLKD